MSVFPVTGCDPSRRPAWLTRRASDNTTRRQVRRPTSRYQASHKAVQTRPISRSRQDPTLRGCSTIPRLCALRTFSGGHLI
jgi:hypothetical protein